MIKEKIISFCESLKNERIQNLFVEIGDPIDSKKFDDIAYEYAVEIDEKIRNVYSNLNGVRLKWQYHLKGIKNDNEYAEGSIRLLKFQDMMIGFDGRMWKNEIWNDKMNSGDTAFYQRLKPFDYYATEAVQCVCLEITPDRKLIPELWLYNQGHEALKLNIEIEEYFDLLEKSKGIWGWQFFYTKIDLSKKQNSVIRRNCEFIINSYSKIFNDGYEKQLNSLFQKLIK